MDYNFHSRIPLADAHSKHILIILVIDSWNFRKLHMNDFLNLNEMRTTQKIQYSTDKKVEFQQDENFEASKIHISEFHIMVWGYYI